MISAAQTSIAAWLAIGGALVTLYCTGMIYASLPTIRAWHQPLVAPIYIVLALATGGVLLVGLLNGFGRDARWAAGVTLLALAAGWLLKARYWAAIDCGGANPHRRGRDRARLSRHGAPARPAAHPAELRDARDGLSGRAQARRQAAAAGGGAAVHRAAVLHAVPIRRPARLRPVCTRTGRCAQRRRSACWSSAGCSSPRRNTSWCSIIGAGQHDGQGVTG